MCRQPCCRGGVKGERERERKREGGGVEDDKRGGRPRDEEREIKGMRGKPRSRKTDIHARIVEGRISRADVRAPLAANEPPVD